MLTNLYCFARHLFMTAPPAGTGAPGSSSPLAHSYLHGGLTIEFVGETRFASPLPFLVLDALILALQLTLFSLNFVGPAPPPVPVVATATGVEDSDSESSRTHLLSDDHADYSGETEPDQDEDEDDAVAALENDPYLTYSGNLVVARIELARTLKHAWNAHINAAASATSAGNNTRTSTGSAAPNTAGTAAGSIFPARFWRAPDTTDTATTATADQDVADLEEGSARPQTQPPEQPPTGGGAQQRLDPSSSLSRLLWSFTSATT